MELEVYEKLSKYKIFRIENCNSELSDLLTIDEALLEIKRQKEYWYSLDSKYSVKYKFSDLLEQIYNQLESAKKSISFKDITESYVYYRTVSDYLYQHYQYNILDKKIYIEYSDYLLISLNTLKIFKDTNSSICNIKMGYVYCLEHNYDWEILQDFMNLYLKDTSISNYVNSRRDSNQHIALLLYISLETKNYPKTNGSAFVQLEINKYEDEIQIINNEISKTKIELSGFNKEYRTELENWKREKEVWYKNKEDELRMLKSNFDKRTQELEKLYSEKLKLDEPCKYWENKSKEFKKKLNCSFGITILLIVVILSGSYFLITTLYDVAKNIKSMNDVFPISFIVLAVISFMLYLLRTCIKIMMSNKHLETEYQQKSMFTYFYLSLLKNDETSKEITTAEKNLIYSNLFSSPDTGLVKTSQDNNDLVTLINAVLKK